MFIIVFVITATATLHLNRFIPFSSQHLPHGRQRFHLWFLLFKIQHVRLAWALILLFLGIHFLNSSYINEKRVVLLLLLILPVFFLELIDHRQHGIFMLLCGLAMMPWHITKKAIWVRYFDEAISYALVVGFNLLTDFLLLIAICIGLSAI